MIDELKDVKVGDCLVLEITPFIAGGTPKLRIVKVAKRTPKRVWLIGVTGQFDLDGYPAANAYGRLRLGKPGEIESLRAMHAKESQKQKEAAEQKAKSQSRPEWKAARHLYNVGNVASVDEILREHDVAAVIAAAKLLGWKEHE